MCLEQTGSVPSKQLLRKCRRIIRLHVSLKSVSSCDTEQCNTITRTHPRHSRVTVVSLSGLCRVTAVSLPDTVVSQPCHYLSQPCRGGVNACHCRVTTVSRLRHCRVTVMSLSCHRHVTVVSPLCHRRVTFACHFQ